MGRDFAPEGIVRNIRHRFIEQPTEDDKECLSIAQFRGISVELMRL